MKFSRPSTGTVLGGIALFVALGGTAAAATGSLVNIADSSNSAYVAHVDSAGRLQVSDDSGTLNVEPTSPSNFFHASALGVDNINGCSVIASAPSTKPIVVRQVRVNVSASTGGLNNATNYIKIYAGKTCTTQIASVNPPSYGQTVIPFDPGYQIPAGSGLSAMSDTEDDFYTDGFIY
jgi:hypothetical protein